MEDWMAELLADRTESAWDRLLDRYRRVIFSAIRFYAREHDDVMDVFARVCEVLRADDFGRLRRYAAQSTRPVRFSTWLVAVVHNITIDWFRHRDGRRRVSAVAETLAPLHRRIFDLVFVQRHTHIEAYERLHAEGPTLPFGEFLAELSATYRALAAGGIHQLSRHLGGAPPIEISEPDVVLDADTREAIAAALSTLDPHDRVAVELYVVEQLPAAEVARIVGLPTTKAVYNRVYRALATLRGHLERAGIGLSDL
jgi:RNA polymerase sigma factor (sigma-70 family)